MYALPQPRRLPRVRAPCASLWTGRGGFGGAPIPLPVLRTSGGRGLTIPALEQSWSPAIWRRRGLGSCNTSIPSIPGTDMPGCVPRRLIGRTTRWAATSGSSTWSRGCGAKGCVSAFRGWSRPVTCGSTGSLWATPRTALPRRSLT